MKRLLLHIGIFITIPLILIVAIYLWTDPFRCLHAFDIHDTVETNREYLSTELFLRNQPTNQYNSFVFCSSRGMGFNTYTWKMYLPEDARPFLFQAWAETVTGIELKVDYLVKQNIPIDNALVLLDIPSSFDKKQFPTIAISRKHYMFTGESKYMYNAGQCFNFMQKPFTIATKIKNTLRGIKYEYAFDTITNDCFPNSKDNYATLPAQDSVSETTRRVFFWQEEHGDTIQEQSEPLITHKLQKQLEHIHEVFVNKGTDYYVIITPGYCYSFPSINEQDLVLLKNIFGDDRVFDYSRKNAINSDYNNYIDHTHFGLRVGYLIMQDIYKQPKRSILE